MREKPYKMTILPFIFLSLLLSPPGVQLDAVSDHGGGATQGATHARATFVAMPPAERRREDHQAEAGHLHPAEAELRHPQHVRHHHHLPPCRAGSRHTSDATGARHPPTE